MEESYVPKPDSHMALAIFCTACCCLPLGIVGILKASKVSDYYMMKQYDAANQAANDAKKWSLIGIVTGGIVSVIYLIFYVIAAVAGA